MNYKVVMAYDGSRYNGWQKQGNTDRTIQGKLEAVLESWKAVRWRSTVQAGQMQVSTQKAR